MGTRDEELRASLEMICNYADDSVCKELCPDVDFGKPLLFAAVDLLVACEDVASIGEFYEKDLPGVLSTAIKNCRAAASKAWPNKEPCTAPQKSYTAQDCN